MVKALRITRVSYPAIPSNTQEQRKQTALAKRPGNSRIQAAVRVVHLPFSVDRRERYAESAKVPPFAPLSRRVLSPTVRTLWKCIHIYTITRHRAQDTRQTRVRSALSRITHTHTPTHTSRPHPPYILQSMDLPPHSPLRDVL